MRRYFGVGELSGHSFKFGAAIVLLDKGIPLKRIMLRCGWTYESTALRYLRNWDDSHSLLVVENINGEPYRPALYRQQLEKYI